MHLAVKEPALRSPQARLLHNTRSLLCCGGYTQEDLVAPGIANANEIFLLLKRNFMGKQALFDLLQSFTSRNGNHVGLQTGSARRGGLRSTRVPGVQADVVMIATGANEKCSHLREIGGNVETQDGVVKLS